MPTYLLSYHGGHLADTEEGIAQVMKEFGRWFQELGPARWTPANRSDGSERWARALARAAARTQ